MILSKHASTWGRFLIYTCCRQQTHRVMQLCMIAPRHESKRQSHSLAEELARSRCPTLLGGSHLFCRLHFLLGQSGARSAFDFELLLLYVVLVRRDCCNMQQTLTTSTSSAKSTSLCSQQQGLRASKVITAPYA